MKVGIVTPVKDSAKYFTACAASVAGQTCGGNIKLVHVIQESSSSRDDCKKTAERFNAQYYREDDAGLYNAISRGMSKPSVKCCDILAWLNSDEQYLPGTIETVVRVFKDNPKVDLVYGDYLIIGKDGHMLSARREIPPRKWYLKNGVNYILSCTVFFKKGLWDRLSGFDLSYKYLADKEFYLNALYSGANFKHINEYLGVYTSTGENASLNPAAADEQKRVRQKFKAYKCDNFRHAVKLCRYLEKFVNGCYRKKMISVNLFDFDGNIRNISGYAGTKWKWE